MPRATGQKCHVSCIIYPDAGAQLQYTAVAWCATVARVVDRQCDILVFCAMCALL